MVCSQTCIIPGSRIMWINTIHFYSILISCLFLLIIAFQFCRGLRYGKCLHCSQKCDVAFIMYLIHDKKAPEMYSPSWINLYRENEKKAVQCKILFRLHIGFKKVKHNLINTVCSRIFVHSGRSMFMNNQVTIIKIWKP